jgi:hypothetical protein
MPELEVSLAAWLSGLLGAACLLGAAALAVRERRWRVWRLALGRPARDFAGRLRPEALPEGVSLQSDLPLFEVLHEAFRMQPGLFTPARVERALTRVGDLGVPRLLDRSRVSDEERVNQLVDLRNYGSNPDYLPFDAVASGVIRNAWSVFRRRKPLRAGVEHSVLDTLTPGGGMAGAKLGGVVGAWLAPALGAVPFGLLPAFLLAGAWMGSLAGRQAGERLKARRLYAALRDVNVAARAFRRAFLRRFPELLRRLERDYEERIALARRLARKSGVLLRLVWPDLMTVFFALSREQLRQDCREASAAWQDLRRRIRSAPPLGLAELLRGLGDDAFAEDAELRECYEAYDAAYSRLRVVQFEHRRAG